MVMEFFRKQVHKPVEERDHILWREGVSPTILGRVLNDGQRVYKNVSYGNPPRPRLCHAMICEVVIQQLLFEWWKTRSENYGNTPVYHPFPCLFRPSDDGPVIVAKKKQDGEEVVQFSMFAFDKIQFHTATSYRMVQILLQVAATLRYFERVGLKFMHMDLHFENVMERRTHRKKTTNGILNFAENDIAMGCIDKTHRSEDATMFAVCGAEVNIIDFGYSWLQLPCGSVIFAGEKHSVYKKADVKFNPQQDLRILIVTYYAALCINHKTSKVVNQELSSPFAAKIQHIVEQAKETSTRFRIATDLPFIKSIYERLLDAQKRASDLDEAIDECVNACADELHEAFVRQHRNVWVWVWHRGSFPPLQHFQYQWGITTVDTPIFEPLNMIRFWLQSGLVLTI
tara:strand:+ start:1086 stop:2282 length:1197 start_codon:yes stop_codon:yes gene_type:complete